MVFFCLHNGNIRIVECRLATESGELPWTWHWMQCDLCCRVHCRASCLATWLDKNLIAWSALWSYKEDDWGQERDLPFCWLPIFIIIFGICHWWGRVQNIPQRIWILWIIKNHQDYYICLSHATSCTPLSALFHQSQLLFPERGAALGRWDRKLCQFLLCSCPAVGDPGDLCHFFPCTSLISRILLPQDLSSTECSPFSCWPPVFPESEGRVSFVIDNIVSLIEGLRIHQLCSHPKLWGLIHIALSWGFRHGCGKCKVRTWRRPVTFIQIIHYPSRCFYN